MLENDLQTLFRLQADADQPASAISIPAAGRSARARARRRRAIGIASPAFAVVAVLAIVVSTALLGAGHAPRSGERGGGPTGPSNPAAIRYLNPLVPYAAFGWLPAGVVVGNGGTGRTWMFLNAQSRSQLWGLMVYAAGQCRLLPPTAKQRRSELTCTGGVAGTGGAAQITGRAPDIHGDPAYWASGYLAWRYARDSWALLQYPYRNHGQPGAPHRIPRSALAVKVADRVRTGPAAPIEFEAELTGVPANWQVADVSFAPQDGRPLASQWQLTAGPRVLPPGGGGYPVGTPTLNFSSASKANTCSIASFRGSFPGSHPVRRVINGYRVFVDYFKRGMYPPEQDLCAADADGLWVYIEQFGRHPSLSVVSLFAHHLRLLGTDPVGWTTEPIG
jgi:hypothetical protein